MSRERVLLVVTHKHNEDQGGMRHWDLASSDYGPQYTLLMWAATPPRVAACSANREKSFKDACRRHEVT